MKEKKDKAEGNKPKKDEKKKEIESKSNLLFFLSLIVLFVSIIIACYISQGPNPKIENLEENKLPNSRSQKIAEWQSELKIKQNSQPNTIKVENLSDAPLFIPLNSTTITTEDAVYKFIGTVPKLEWSPEKPFAWESVNRNFPVVLKNTVANTWEAMKWTPEKVVSILGEDFILQNAYKHSNPIFGPYWDNERPMSKLPSIQRNNPHQFVNMSAGSFLEKLRNPSKGEYLYFASNINKVVPISPDLEPWKMLELHPESKYQNMNFWMGMKGTISYTHYDAYENFNVQVYGRKRWILFAPDQPLYVYPFLHPSHAQCQVSIDEPDLKHFPKLKQAEALEVIMEPGDMLYLPPLWYHHVEALDTTNCWSFSSQSDFLKGAFSETNNLQTLITKHSWARNQIYVVIKVFIVELLDKVKGENQAIAFVENLIETRYENLFQTKQLPRTDKNGIVCDSEVFSRKDIKSIKKEIDPILESISDMLTQLPKNVRDVWLSNYIEYVAATATMDPSTAGAYLNSCVLSE